MGSRAAMNPANAAPPLDPRLWSLIGLYAILVTLPHCAVEMAPAWRARRRG